MHDFLFSLCVSFQMNTQIPRKKSEKTDKERTTPSKLAVNTRSKSDTSSFSSHHLTKAERERKIRELVEHKELLEKALNDALDQNRRLLNEARRRQSLEKQYEDEKDLTAMLTIITEAVKESGKQMAEKT